MQFITNRFYCLLEHNLHILLKSFQFLFIIVNIDYKNWCNLPFKFFNFFQTIFCSLNLMKCFQKEISDPSNFQP